MSHGKAGVVESAAPYEGVPHFHLSLAMKCNSDAPAAPSVVKHVIAISAI
jgi:hypothetical protein